MSEPRCSLREDHHTVVGILLPFLGSLIGRFIFLGGVPNAGKGGDEAKARE